MNVSRPRFFPIRAFRPRYLSALAVFTAALSLGAAIPFSSAAPVSAAPVSAAPALDSEDQRVTERLNWLLNKRIKNPNGEKINIVVTPTSRSSEGYFSQIRINGAPAQLKKQLRVSEFSLDARDVHIDVPSLWNGNRVRTYQSKTKLRAVITEDDLTSMLSRGKSTANMNLKVKYLGDKMQVTGNLNWMLLNGPVSGLARLRMAPGHKIYLDILSLQLRGVEVPQFVKNKFSSHINPVIDYTDLPFNPPFKGVKVVGNKAILTT